MYYSEMPNSFSFGTLSIFFFMIILLCIYVSKILNAGLGIFLDGDIAIFT